MFEDNIQYTQYRQEELDDTKAVIIIRLSQNRQHNGQRKRAKGQTTIYKTYI
jgi:hypothetical protein